MIFGLAVAIEITTINYCRFDDYGHNTGVSPHSGGRAARDARKVNRRISVKYNTNVMEWGTLSLTTDLSMWFSTPTLST